MMEPIPLRVLVVDDTVIYRKIVSDILSGLPGVEVVGVANNGKIAMSRIELQRPDLVILDVEMPEADGLEVLAFIRQKALPVGAVMLSSFTRKGSDRTIQALELGAFDFIPKPETHATTKVIKLTDDPPENGCRPAVDALFRSVAQHYGGRATAVVMTGMGSDGKLGAALLRRQGALILAQEAKSCVVYGMPKEVIEAGLADGVLLIGSSEYLAGISSRFAPQRHCRAVYYQLQASPVAQTPAPTPQTTPSKPQPVPFKPSHVSPPSARPVLQPVACK